MAITYTDSWGAVTDTGTGVQPTARAYVDVEYHRAGEIDTGSTKTISGGAGNILSQRARRNTGDPR